MSIPQVAMIPLAKLRPSTRNARTHSKKQIGQIANSIRRFGWTYPILTDQHHEIIAGFGRYKAAEHLGLNEVPVVVMTGLNEVEKRALALADNKIAANAGWDRAILAAELGELALLLPECDLNIDITGFEPAEIESLVGNLGYPGQDPADEVPAIEKMPVSRGGDLWLLGRHRLLCGDARKVADLQNLMGPGAAAMVITDPPCIVAVSSTQGRRQIKHGEFLGASGELSNGEFDSLLLDALSLAARHSADGSTHYVFTDWRHLAEVLAAGHKVYGAPKDFVVWVKTNAGQGGFYRSQHELVFVFKNGDGTDLNKFEPGRRRRLRSNVWTYADIDTLRPGRPADLPVHPTVKPVALISDAMRDCSKRGDIVLDPFMGSGTTIMAAERVGRRAYGLDLDPLYVDVAVRRWQTFTGSDAVLAGTPNNFDEVAASRGAAKQGQRP
jgi:DNA modification methylase